MPAIFFSSLHGPVLTRQIDPAETDLRWVPVTDPACLSGAADDRTYWITWDEPAQGMLLPEVPFERRVLCLTEPPEYKDYTVLLPHHRYILSPFAIHPSALAPGSLVIRVPPLINWFYGYASRGDKPGSDMNLPALINEPAAVKKKTMAIVCSSIATLPAHRQRLAFLNLLRKLFPDKIDFYGKGFSFIPDKRDAVRDYHYLITLENNFHPHFWTEKISDAYLGRAVPVYAGCPNITDYFPSEAVIPIDFRATDRAVETIAALLAQKDDADYQARLPYLEIARQRLFTHFNAATALPRLLRYISRYPDCADARKLAEIYLDLT